MIASIRNALLRSSLPMVAGLVLLQQPSSCDASSQANDAQPKILRTLSDIINAGLTHDAQHQTDKLELAAAQKERLIAGAELLPALSVSIRDSIVKGSLEGTGLLGTPEQRDLDYRNRVNAITGRQTLFSLDAFARSRLGQLRSELAEIIFQRRSSELMSRILLAGIEARHALSEVEASRAYVDALSAQNSAAKARFLEGDGTRQEIADVEGRLALARLAQLDSEEMLRAAMNQIQKSIGPFRFEATRLTASGKWPAELDMPLSAWQADSSVNSHLLMAQRKRIEISETEREARRGARFPRIDAFAGYSHARGESVSTAGQTTKQATAGLALTMPLYQGGRLSEVEAQSVLLAQREESELENLRSQLATEIARGHQRVSSIPERMNQLRSAQESAELGLKAAVAGHQAGTLPIWVVLDAERRLYLMRREVSKSIRESMIALVNLYVASGRFDPSRITWMESFVAGNTRQ